MTFELYQDAADEWRWRLVASNGEVVACSGEGYKNKGDAVYAISLVMNCADADVDDPPKSDS